MTLSAMTERVGSGALKASADSLGLPEASGLPLERVEAEICTLAGQIAAATCRFLRLLAEFDAREGWTGWQVKSCAHWLSWRCGMDLRTAHEHVRVARRLAGLPRTVEAFGQGRLSYSKVRALTRVATPETEADLVEAALDAPAAQLERLLRGLQTASDRGTVVRKACHGVSWRWDDDGSLVVWGRLDADSGGRLLAGLTRMECERTATTDTESASGGSSAEPGPEDGGGCSAEPSGKAPSVAAGVPSDLGPALVAAAELACSTAEALVHAPGAEVVVHVDVDTFVETARHTHNDDGQSSVEVPQVVESTVTSDERPADHDQTRTARPTPRRPSRGQLRRLARLDDGPSLRAAMVQMLACDARIQLSVDGPDGRTLDLGRRRRRPTDRQILALWRRDRGCAVPGCGRTRFLHAHHVRPWALGGKTSLDNLVLLCGEHHRALHHGAFGIVVLGRQRFRFRAPDGAILTQAPTTTGDAAELAAAHRDVIPTTIEPDWDGSNLHLHDTITTYLTRWANQAA